MSDSAQQSSLGDRVKLGFLWTILGRGGNQLISFCFGIALARLLAPEDFGTVAACIVFTEVGSTLVAASYVSTLIRKQTISSIELNTVFWLQVITGVLVALLIAGISPWVGVLLKHEAVAPVLAVLSINLVILSLQGVPNVLVQRELDFKTVTKAAVFEMLTFGVIAVSLAVNGWGVWSLVIGRIAGRLVSTVLFTVWTRWLPSMQFSCEVAKSIMGMSTQFAGKEILDDVSKNIAYLFTGWAQGMQQLGFYSRAHYLMTLPVDRISKSLERVLFPAFAQMQDDQSRLKRAFLKSNCLMAVMVSPALVGLSLVAPALIVLVYGEKWAPSVLPLQVICFAGIFYAMESPAIALINALGLLKSEILRQLVHIALILSCISVGMQYGLVGIAAGVSVSSLLYWCLLAQLLKRRIQLPWLTFVASIMPAMIASAVMAVVVLLWQHALLIWVEMISMIMLISSIVVGAVAYSLVMLAFVKLSRNAIWGPAMQELDATAGKVLGRLPGFSRKQVAS